MECASCNCDALPVPLPSTRRSKSSSPTPEEPNGSLDGMLIRSFERGLSNPFVEFEASSLSFLVCSCSILEDKLLMRVIYSWNCCRLSSGPRLKLHSMGRASMARKSVSASLPTCWKTCKAAMITAGSLVFIPLRSGTTFSWTVYLSRIEVLGVFNSRVVPLGFPPQRITKASRARTLIPRLLVLLKTAATMGNRSFLTVEKSKTESTVGRHVRALSTSECVGDSRPSWMIGRISTGGQHMNDTPMISCIPSLKFFPAQFAATKAMFSSTTIKAASLCVSRSFEAPLVPTERKISRS